MWLLGRATQICLMAIASTLLLGACNGSSSNNSEADKPLTAKARVASVVSCINRIFSKPLKGQKLGAFAQ